MPKDKEWIKDRKKALELIEAFKKPRDRLEAVRNMILSLGELFKSMEGWRQWCANILVMESIPREALIELSQVFVEQVRGFLELDIEVTEHVELPQPVLPLGVTMIEEKPKVDYAT